MKPTATLPASVTTDEEEESASAALQGRAAALRQRAELLRMPVRDQDDFERLRLLLAR